MEEEYTIEKLSQIFPGFDVTDFETRLGLITALKRRTKMQMLDKQIIQSLTGMVELENQTVTDLNNKVELIHSSEFDKVLKRLDDSFVVYFRSADLFRVYNQKQIKELLENHINTNYRRNVGPVYEVVHNNSPQKILILGDKSALVHIGKIKNFIVKFMKIKKVDVPIEDILVMERGDLIEILINGVSVQDSNERDKLIKELLDFIDLEENSSDVTSKLNKREKAEFKDVQLYPIPSQKIVTGTTKTGDFRNLISVVDSGVQIRTNGTVINIGNLTIHNTVQVGSIHNTVNNTVKNVTNNITKNVTKIVLREPIGDFVSYIRDHQPEWYKPSGYILKDVIYDEYVKVFGNISKVTFFRIFKLRLFSDDIRSHKKGKGGRKVKMYEFDKLVDLNPDEFPFLERIE